MSTTDPRTRRDDEDEAEEASPRACGTSVATGRDFRRRSQKCGPRCADPAVAAGREAALGEPWPDRRLRRRCRRRHDGVRALGERRLDVTRVHGGVARLAAPRNDAQHRTRRRSAVRRGRRRRESVGHAPGTAPVAARRRRRRDRPASCLEHRCTDCLPGGSHRGGAPWAARRLAREPTLILGSGEVAEDLFETLRRAPEHGFEPIGLVADSASGSVPVACSLAELPVTVRVLAVRHVIVAFAPNRDSEIAATVRELRLGSTTQVHVVSRLFELGATGRVLGSSAVGPFRTTQLRRPPHRRPAYRAKRMFDVGVAGMLLVLFSPILAATAVAVRSTSRGPAFYRQTRIGRDGRLIELVKFRSMVVNGDGDTTWNVSNDERVTRVGSVPATNEPRRAPSTVERPLG